MGESSIAEEPVGATAKHGGETALVSSASGCGAVPAPGQDEKRAWGSQSLVDGRCGGQEVVGLFPTLGPTDRAIRRCCKQVHGRRSLRKVRVTKRAELRAHWTRLETGVVSPHRPDDARQLVGQGDGGAVVAPQAMQPQRPSS